MSTMIERVAAFLKDRDESVLPHEIDDEERIGSAKAILELMREPTEKMAHVGGIACVYSGDDGRNGVNRANAYEAYTAMIDAALKEESKP